MLFGFRCQDIGGKSYGLGSMIEIVDQTRSFGFRIEDLTWGYEKTTSLNSKSPRAAGSVSPSGLVWGFRIQHRSPENIPRHQRTPF